jgi:hypothetical protein
VAQLGESLGFDLADALASDPERLADLFERFRLAAVETEPHPHDLLLALAQLTQHLLDSLVQHRLSRGVGRAVDRVVLDEVGEVGLVLLPHRRVERERVL